MPRDSERIYTELLFSSSNKYAAWDPEVEMLVGDYGIITHGRRAPWYKFWAWNRRQGVFLKQGNIYDPEKGFAKKFKVPRPVTNERARSTGVSWVVSQNASEADMSAELSAQTPLLANCGVKASFQFRKGEGAVLAMENDLITTISTPGALRSLLKNSSLSKGTVIVSEVHSTSSYARYIATPEVKQVTIGLKAAPPATAGAATVGVGAQWLASTTIGNFKSKTNPNGKRTYYPLFRLASLDDGALSTGLR